MLDCLRERRPPFSPEDAVREFAETLRAYGCSEVVGDRFGGEFPRELFGRYGIAYRVAAKSKSEIYRECLPRLNAATVELLDHPKLLEQFASLIPALFRHLRGRHRGERRRDCRKTWATACEQDPGGLRSLPHRERGRPAGRGPAAGGHSLGPRGHRGTAAVDTRRVSG